MSLPHIVLVGNPNVGKSTLFNRLTGLRQPVSNWTGTTVAGRQGIVRHCGGEALLVDLPGTYSLTPYSPEEQIVRNYLLAHPIDLVLNILDATKLERNLYLTVQLMETGLPMTAVLNRIDIFERRGHAVDLPRLSAHLGIPLFATHAQQGDGLDALRAHLPLAFAGSTQSVHLSEVPSCH